MKRGTFIALSLVFCVSATGCANDQEHTGLGSQAGAVKDKPCVKARAEVLVLVEASKRFQKKPRKPACEGANVALYKVKVKVKHKVPIRKKVEVKVKIKVGGKWKWKTKWKWVLTGKTKWAWKWKWKWKLKWVGKGKKVKHILKERDGLLFVEGQKKPFFRISAQAVTDEGMPPVGSLITVNKKHAIVTEVGRNQLTVFTEGKIKNIVCKPGTIRWNDDKVLLSAIGGK